MSTKQCCYNWQSMWYIRPSGIFWAIKSKLDTSLPPNSHMLHVNAYHGEFACEDERLLVTRP